ncbi:hypothetical protein SAMN02746065_10419 [Desulfocicer vacuolatum DSM 3385]|uniref:Uncharacterized protein n=1 Tax=Desulfocicer vacuolatum DSM 3385 TaxID=1121400 RepID=A0A1W2A2C8_9BACT|nr:hypothetical protein SAMN02746065_10419 [Desulfocicer vacuolatum DSM 3385]
MGRGRPAGDGAVFIVCGLFKWDLDAPMCVLALLEQYRADFNIEID